MVSRPQINMRLDARTAEMLVWLERKLNQPNAAAVVRLALARLAEAEGWKDER